MAGRSNLEQLPAVFEDAELDLVRDRMDGRDRE